MFASNKTLLVFPIKIVYQPITKSSGVKIGVSASSRHFKKAVDRNRIKRLLREVYRHKKHLLAPYAIENGLHIFFLYIDKVLPTHALLTQKMNVAIKKIIQQLNTNNEATTTTN